MADATQAIQTILTVGMPTLAVLVGILVNNSRLSDLRGYMDVRFADVTQRFAERFDAERRVNDANFKMILDKIEDIYARLTRLEERFAR